MAVQKPSNPKLQSPEATALTNSRQLHPQQLTSQLQPQLQILARLPHPQDSFTQGLTIVDGRLYESSGLYGKSFIRYSSLKNGKILNQVSLPQRRFAEGSTLLNNRLYQLSWKQGVVSVHDIQTLQTLREFRYHGQGWGLTNNGQQLIMSNGSAKLQFMQANNFSLQKTMIVRHHGKPVSQLNELEWVNGKIFANIWKSNEIVVINPNSGEVEASIDASHLSPSKKLWPNANVLNGIAWDKDQQYLYITGKLWPYMYRTKIIWNRTL